MVILRILLATSETALDAFRDPDSPVDAELVAELERMAERTRRELAVLGDFARPGPDSQ